MNLEIKKATIDNLKDIQNLNLMLFKKEYKEFDSSSLNLNWTFWKEWTKYYKKRLLKDDWCVFIAIINKKIIGYLCWWISKAENYRILPIVWELENMFVLDEYRSKWIWKKLYDNFKIWCKEKNVWKLRVVADYKNKLWIIFYKKMNFKEYSLILEKDLN